MKPTLAFAFSLATYASAQSACNSVAAKVPSCATECLNTGAKAAGCGEQEYSCQCDSAKAATIQTAAGTCILSKCSSELSAVQAAVQAVCSCAKTAGAEPASTATSTTMAMEMSMATAKTEPTNATPNTAYEATPGTTKEAAAEQPTDEASNSTATNEESSVMTSAASYATGAAPVAVGTGGMTMSSITPFTGGAVAAVGSVGGIMGAILAIIAAL